MTTRMEVRGGRRVASVDGVEARRYSGDDAVNLQRMDEGGDERYREWW